MRSEIKSKLVRNLSLVLVIISMLSVTACQLSNGTPTDTTKAPANTSVPTNTLTTQVNSSTPSTLPSHDPSIQTIASNKGIGADFHCDGISDNNEFQAAIDALPASGGKIQVIAGKYLFDKAVSIPSNVEIDLANSTIQLSGPPDQDSAVFTNTDKQTGNTGINIHGGHLVGKENNAVSANQYGVNFTKVTNSQVDCWIEDFNTADQLMIDCNLVFNNRNYDDAYTPRTKWLARCDSLNDFTPTQNVVLDTDGQGNKYITISALQASDTSVRVTKASDIRFYPLVYFSLRDSSKYGSNPYLFLYNERLNKFIGLDGTNFTQFATGVDGWNQYILSLSTIDWKETNTTPSDFLKDCFLYITLHNSSAASTRTYQIDNIYALRGINEGIVTLEFDDGFGSVFDNGKYMSKYGYKGVVGAIGEATSVSQDHMTADELKQMYDMGWDICNHSWAHRQIKLTPGEQWIEDYTGVAYLESLGFSRSAMYRLYTGSQSELTYQESQSLYSARRSVAAVGTNLPYGEKQYLSGTQFTTKTIERARQLAQQAKKFHVWVMPFCHSISDADGIYETTIAAYEQYIDFLYSIGAKVRTISEVYTEYPPAADIPKLDFTMHTFTDQYSSIKAASPDSIASGIDMGGVGLSPIAIAAQPDYARSVTWAFSSHNNITDFSLTISGLDAKGINQTETFTEKDGWSGETSNAFASISSIILTKLTGTGAGDKLNIGTGSRLGLTRGIFRNNNITKITRNGVDYTSDKYRVDTLYSTIDVSAGEQITAGDTYIIEYTSNFNDLLWLKFK